MSSGTEDEGTRTKITRKGQVTIPKELRDRYGLEEGDELIWEAEKDGLKVRQASQAAGRGMLVDDSVSEEEREAMAREMTTEIREKRRTDWSPK